MATSGTGLALQGAYDIEEPNCGIYVNSNSTDAIDVTGNGGTVNAGFLDVVGNASLKHQTSPTTATMNAAPRSNPFGGLTGPTPGNGGCTTTNTTATSITGTVTGPGLDNAICYTQAVTINGATLGPGVYAPGAEVYLQDHGGSVTAIGIVAAWMYDKASVLTIPNYNAVHSSTSPFRVVTLVE